MHWIWLGLAGVLEVVWAVGLRATDGWTKLWPSVWTGAALLGSVWLLSLALRTLPVGTGYAIWTGIGVVGTTLVGVLWLGESASLARLACIALIVAGVIGLKLLTPA